MASLSQSDVDRLLTDSSARTRAEVAGKLGQAIDSPALTEAERRNAQDIVRIMARDVEVGVRAALARSLRQATHVPHDVAVLLARDVDGVALPILSHSLVLTDHDLIDIVRAGTGAKQAAVAGRADVPEPVAAALATMGDEASVAVLMRNPGAHVGEQSLGQAIDRFADSDTVKEAMALRESLPIAVTERLVVLVSDRLREHLVAHHNVSPDLATDIVLQTRERATLDLGRGVGDDHLTDLAAQMHRAGRLTPTLVLRALCIGDMAFFEAALAAMAGLPVDNARILIHDGGPRGFAAIYQRSGLQPDMFPVFRAATDAIEGTQLDGEARDLERFRARIITRMLTQFEEFDPSNLDYLVAKLGEVLEAPEQRVH
jgi:uncharacterized protein (DUF2336 family)